MDPPTALWFDLGAGAGTGGAGGIAGAAGTAEPGAAAGADSPPQQSPHMYLTTVLYTGTSHSYSFFTSFLTVRGCPQLGGTRHLLGQRSGEHFALHPSHEPQQSPPHLLLHPLQQRLAKLPQPGMSGQMSSHSTAQ